LSCVALGSDTQGTHKEQNLLFVRHARGRKLESGVQKNRSIKPKIRWKEKGLPDVWQGQHQVLEVQQALISLTQEIICQPAFYILDMQKHLPFCGGCFFHILPFPSPFGMIEKSGSLPPAGRGEFAQRRDS